MTEDHEMPEVGPAPAGVSLHIERVVLDGLPLPASSADQVRFAMEVELSRLFTESGLTNASDGVHRSVTATGFQLAEKVQPAEVGKQIAQSVYRSLSETT